MLSTGLLVCALAAVGASSWLVGWESRLVSTTAVVSAVEPGRTAHEQELTGEVVTATTDRLG